MLSLPLFRLPGVWGRKAKGSSFTFQSARVMSDELQEPTSPQSVFMAVGTLAMCTTLLLLIASFW
jgi:hypothetical protein